MQRLLILLALWSSPALAGSAVFYSNGQFVSQCTCPHLIRLVGGGSSGGGGSKGGGRGGGAGSDVSAVLNLTYGQTVDVIIGKAGAPGNGVASGWGGMSESGGNSYFGPVAAAGGPQTHGGDPVVAPGQGATPGEPGMGMGGGPGADANGTDGGDAAGFGAGGGGGGGNPSGKGGDGGRGRDGIAIVSW